MELFPFKRKRRPEADVPTQVAEITGRGLLADLEDIRQHFDKPGARLVYAFIDVNREVLNMVTTPSDKPMPVELMRALEDHYSTPDNVAVCAVNPAPEVVSKYGIDLASMLDA